MSDIRYSIKNFNENVDHFSKDVNTFLDKGNKSAAVRARKALLEISKLSKLLRKQIQDIKNSNSD